jgi:teichuronic acid biosynthesis glycosyltransferase TuaC
MRVLAFTTVFPSAAHPQHGLFVKERLRHCAAHAEIRVVAPRPFFDRAPAPREEEIGGLAVSHPTFFYTPRIGKPFDGYALYASARAEVQRLAQGFRPDLVDAHFGFPDGFAAVRLARMLGVPAVITLRGTEPMIATIGRMRRRALASALSQADRLIAVSHPLAELARELVAETGRPMPPVAVIENGVDSARFTPGDAAAARRALGLPEAGRLLVSVGHLSPRKGFQRVLRVLPEVFAQAPDLRFAVVGGPGAEGDNGAELRRLAAPLGERVVFAGAQPPEDVAQWLRAADLFVLASDQEGCPNVVWEALATGLPVVATQVGEIPRMVPEPTGRLFAEPEDGPALRDALLDALGHPFDRAAIRAWAERHTWEGVAVRVAAEWRAAIAGRGVA